MRTTTGPSFWALCAGMALVSPAALAHHGDAGRYQDTMTTITGVVVEFNFVNPHSTIVLDVEEEGGYVERWHAETGNPTGLRRRGLTPGTLRVGDTITISGRARRNGEPYMSVTGGARVFDANGNEIYHGD